MKLLFTLLSAFFASQAFSQLHYNIVNSESTVQYLKKKSGGAKTVIRSVPVEIEYWADSTKDYKKITDTFAIDTADGKVFSPSLNTIDFTIDSSELSTKHQKKTIKAEVVISATDPYSYGGFRVKLKNGKGEVSVRVTEDDRSIDEKTKYDGRPFWIEVGTNLDLVDGPKANNFTAGIFFQKFDHRWGRASSDKWASFAGAYEAKIVSNITNLKFGAANFVNNKSFIPNNPDTIKLYRYAGKPKQTQTIRNWSFFYSPAVRIKGGKYDDGNFHLYLSLWAELRYQEVETKTDNSSLILLDSSRVPISTIGNYKQADDSLVRSNAYSHYLGVGFPIYTEGKDFSFLLNPVFGLTSQLTGVEYDSLASTKFSNFKNNHKWHPFYFVQFRLADNEFGLTVTGEIRGLILRNSPPQYTIALTKKFNLQKLIYYK